ncbi:MAG: cyclic nucleotide-binding domain-containing protein [Chloroflexi bacterium]|nr:cyclic nucleotide-binding domain-containing protein [Chloroflexota bacterium]
MTWAVIIALLQLAVGTAFLTTPEAALQFWYLLAAPIVLSAFHFGLRGVIVTSGLSMLILTAAFIAAGQAVLGQTSWLRDRLIEAATSPREAAILARQLTDLRYGDQQIAFARALLGLVLVVISCMMLGTSVDNRERVTRLLERAFHALRRYFSPQVVEVIISREGDGFSSDSARREVTILFADLRSFTALAERLEPEATVQLLNEFLGAMTEEIFRQDGTLDKYLGDGLMAFFGDPTWYPDHPERAFRAAIAMQQRMRELQSRWQAEGRETLGMGIGIATGPAVVGNIGSASRMEYTAIGSTVNIASRLTDLAGPGQILTVRKTYWRAQHAVDGALRGDVLVKGFSQPIDLVEILGVRFAPVQEQALVTQRLADAIGRVVEDPAYRAVLLGSPEKAAAATDWSEEERHLIQQVAILSGHPLFQDVPAGEIAALIAAASVEHYRKGTVVVRQDASEDKFYLILQGDMTVTVLDETNQERHVASLARGDHFGEVALLFDIPRTASVRASADSTLLVLHRDSFYAVLNQAPTLRGKIEVSARARSGMSVAQPLSLTG